MWIRPRKTGRIKPCGEGKGATLKQHELRGSPPGVMILVIPNHRHQVSGWRQRRTSLWSVAVPKNSGPCFSYSSGERSMELSFLPSSPWNKCFLVKYSMVERGLHTQSITVGFLFPLWPLTSMWLGVASPPLWAAVPLGEVTSSLRPFTDLIF